jgi:hypothetical protein
VKILAFYLFLVYLCPMKNYIVSDKLQAQLDAYQNSPLTVGETVEIEKSNVGFGGSSQSPNEIVSYNIVAIDGDNITISVKQYGRMETKVVNRSVILKKTDYRIGINPLKNEMPRVSFYSIDIWQLLGRTGYDDDGSLRTDGRSNRLVEGIQVNELSWNPFIFDKTGEKIYYQRGFEWTLEQNQLLIESIYNEITIGTFIVRRRSYNEVVALIKQGHTDVAFHDIVDGKQRLNALISFVANEYPDFEGNYFGDFSEYGKRQFMGYSRLNYGLLEDNTPDKSVHKIFLNHNFAGAPMSMDHINFVKSINI